MVFIIFRKYDWKIEKSAENTESDDGFEVFSSKGNEFLMSVLESVGSRFSWSFSAVKFLG
jgi:hypothetical protein